VFLKNLTLHDYDNPSANHILDTDIPHDNPNLLILVGMLGGIEFYDISSPETLNHLDNLTLSSGGGGGGTKPNCIIAAGDYAYVTTNQGLGVINISNPSNPQYLGIVSGTNGYIFENLDIYGNTLAVSAHEDGVLLFDISNPSNPDYFNVIPSENAWAVLLSMQSTLYIADESILKLWSLQEGGILVNSVELSNSIKDLKEFNYHIYVALGSDGVAVLNNSFEVVASYNTSAMANRIDLLDDGKIVVSDWDDIEVLEFNGDDLTLVGFKNTTRRTMAVSTKDNFIYSGEWASLQVFEYGLIEGPDVDLSSYELNYPYVENGNSYTMSLDVTNNGNSSLNIIDAYTTNSEFSYTQLYDLSPGETQSIDITYTANAMNASGSYRIYSNDPDEFEVMCETNGNINGANIGDAAPDFNLPIIANGTGTFRLSDHLGEIVVLAFFAPN